MGDIMNLNKIYINACFIVSVIFLSVFMLCSCETIRNKSDTAGIPILTFHRIVTDENKMQNYADDKWVQSVTDFRKEMEYLYQEKYNVISLSEFENWYDGKTEYSPKTVVLTFDDGDYELYYLVLPILKKYNFPATAFIIGSYTGDKTPELTDERHQIGMDKISQIKRIYPKLDFESHTYDLHSRDGLFGLGAVYETPYVDLQRDFHFNKKFKFKYLAYPYGDFTPNMIEASKNNGIRMAFKFKISECATRSDNRYEIPRVKITGDMSYDDFSAKIASYL